MFETIMKIPSTELDFFENCANKIIECRQILKWSYVVGYIVEPKLPENES